MVNQIQPIAHFEHLQRQLQGQTILNDINVTIAPGDVIGLVGKNGAGKTTLLETMLGFGYPAFGQVHLWGERATELSASSKQRIGFVPQRDELLSMMNGKDHLMLYRTLRQRWNQELVEQLCWDWEIPMERPANKMSVGERQKLSILLALAHEPELLVLDEPVAALDPIARRQFLQQLVEVAADQQRAIVFSSHIISDLERVANRVWLLKDASLAWAGGVDELKESVVRIRVVSEEPLKRPQLEGLLAWGSETRGGWLVCQGWDGQKAQALTQQTGAETQLDYLGLEDIFLYFNQRSAPMAKELAGERVQS